MNIIAANKLKMYKAVETVCAQNHLEWSLVPGFGSAFSLFSAKVAQLDLLSDDVNEANDKPAELIQKLLHEIDQLLRNSIDSLVRFLRNGHSDFYSLYVSARTRL